jgi:hypothetical protein
VAGDRWQAEWIFAPLAGRQGHPGATVRLGIICSEGVGCWGRRVFWALGALRRRRRGLRTGVLREASPYVVLKHPSRWRRDPWRLFFWALGAAEGVGCLGVGCAAGPPPGRWVFGGSATRSLYRDFDGPSESSDRAHHDGIVGVAVRCTVGLVIAERWVFGRWVLWALGARQGHPRGVGCWALGGLFGPRATTRSLYGDFNTMFGSPDRALHDAMVAAAVAAP